MVGRNLRIARITGIIALMALSGCYGEEETLPGASQSQKAQPAAATEYWLKLGDQEDTLTFLARVTDSDAKKFAADFERALALYQESPRMIANRMVQLWQEIGQNGDRKISMARLLADFTAAGTMEEHGLGSVIQRYRVLRARGRTHNAAIASATGIKQ